MAENNMCNNFLVDWLSFTVFKNMKTTKEALFKFDKEFPFFVNSKSIKEIKPLLGYTQAWQLGESGIIVCANMERPDMGIHVIVSGSNMGQLIDMLLINPDQDGYALASAVLKEIKQYDPDFSIARIDLAFDDYEKVYYPYDYMKFHMQHRLNLCGSRIAPSFVHCSPDGGGTAYFGRRTSRKMLRIYDKNVESSGRIDAIRYEAELHKEYAMRAAEIIMSDKGYDFSDLVRIFVVVHNPIKYEDGELVSKAALDMRRQRAGVDPKFSSLFSGLTQSAIFKVSAVKREFSLDRKLVHLQDNIAPQILLLVDVCHGDWDFVLELIKGQSYSDRHKKEYEILRSEYDQIMMGLALRP